MVTYSKFGKILTTYALPRGNLELVNKNSCPNCVMPSGNQGLGT